MSKKNEHVFCKGDRLLFDEHHVHYAKGYCFNEYQKARYRAKHPKPEIPPVPRICKGCGLPFNDDHQHYALGRCRRTYALMRRGLPDVWHRCPKCPVYFPDKPPRIVPIKNGLCDRCKPFIMALMEKS